MKKKVILTTLTILMLAFGVYEKFYVCNSTSRASTDHLAKVCTQATVSLGKRYDALTQKRDAVKQKATAARVVRDNRVAKINEAIKQDVVFQQAQK